MLLYTLANVQRYRISALQQLKPKPAISLIYDGTGVSILYIYISKSTDDYWEDDMLGESEMLSNGSNKTYNLNSYDSWDILLIDENENTYSLLTTVHLSGFTWTVTSQSMD